MTAALALTPVVLAVPAAVAMVLAIATVLFLLLSVVVAIEIIEGHGRTNVPVCWFQRDAVSGFIDLVRSAASDRGPP